MRGPMSAKTDTLRLKVSPLRTTPKLRRTDKLPRTNLLPKGASRTQPASLRGKGLSLSGMRKAALGKQGRVVNRSFQSLKRVKLKVKR